MGKMGALRCENGAADLKMWQVFSFQKPLTGLQTQVDLHNVGT